MLTNCRFSFCTPVHNAGCCGFLNGVSLQRGTPRWFIKPSLYNNYIVFSFTSLSYWMLLKLLTKLANPSQLYINCKSPSLLVQPPCIYRLPGHSPNQPMVESNLSRLPKSAPEKKQLKVCFSLLIKSINKYIYNKSSHSI